METNTSTKYKGPFIFYRKEGWGGGGEGGAEDFVFVTI